MANHTVTFPVTDPQEILKLRAGDEVTVQGHIIGIRDRTQMRIFDEGVEPPMALWGACLLHTAPNVRKVAEHKYEKICIGTTTIFFFQAEDGIRDLYVTGVQTCALPI